MDIKRELTGDLPEDVAKHLRNHILFLIGRTWWQDRRSMVGNEGGPLGMEASVMSYFSEELIDSPDEDAERLLQRALKRYRSYLSKEYGSSYKRNNSVDSLEMFVKDDIPLAHPSSPLGTISPLPVEPLHVEFFDLTKSELDTLTVLVSTLSCKEVGEYLGLSVKAAEQRVRRLRKKLRPQLMERLDRYHASAV